MLLDPKHATLAPRVSPEPASATRS